MPTLYLHIGIPKTGTTAIQHFCRANKPALAKKGYCYPIFLKRYPLVPMQRNGHFLADYMERASKPETRAEQERIWRRRMNYIARLFRKYSAVVFSDENLWYYTKFFPADMWKLLKEEGDRRGFDVKVIVYLRRQDQFLVSWWAQKVKENHPVVRGLRFEDLIAEPDQYHGVDYFDQLERIAAHIGRENICVRVYERKRFPNGDAVADFFQEIGLELDGSFTAAEEEFNPSVDGNELEILHQFTTLPGYSRDFITLARQAAINCCSTGPRRKYSMFDRQELDRLLERYAESNRRVAEVYLKSDAPLFDPPPAELPPKWTPDNPWMQEDSARFFGELTRLQAERANERRRLKSRLRASAEKLKKGAVLAADYLLLR